MKPQSRHGFTLMEFVVTVTAITVLASLILPTVFVQTREASRKQACSDNLRRIGLALLQYEQTYKRLVGYNCTWGYGGYSDIPFLDSVPGYDGVGRWGGFIALLPYLDRAALHDGFHNGTTGMSGSRPCVLGALWFGAQCGSSPYPSAPAGQLRYAWSSDYRPSRTQVGVFRCPSDPSKVRPGSMWNTARTNYAFCLGDGQVGIHGDDPLVPQTRGAFQRNMHYEIASITDGANFTIAFGEIATSPSSMLAKSGQGVIATDAKVQGNAIYELAQQSDQKGIDVHACRALVKEGRYAGKKRIWSNLGVRCYDAVASSTGFNTINAPNGGSCTPTDDAWGEGEGIYTAGSYHRGGAHFVTFAGDVKFFADSISTADIRLATNFDDYYSPGRQWTGQWSETANWRSLSPFGVWGGFGTIASYDSYDNCACPDE